MRKLGAIFVLRAHAGLSLWSAGLVGLLLGCYLVTISAFKALVCLLSDRECSADTAITQIANIGHSVVIGVAGFVLAANLVLTLVMVVRSVRRRTSLTATYQDHVEHIVSRRRKSREEDG